MVQHAYPFEPVSGIVPLQGLIFRGHISPLKMYLDLEIDGGNDCALYGK